MRGIVFYMASQAYGPTFWLHPCGTIHFLDQIIGNAGQALRPLLEHNSQVQPLLISEAELLSEDSRPLIAKIFEYFEQRLQSQSLTAIITQYSANLHEMIERYSPLFLYAVMEEYGWKNPWGMNLTRYRRELENGCLDWPSSTAAVSDLNRFLLSVPIKQSTIQLKVMHKQKKMLRRYYHQLFGENDQVLEYWKKVFVVQNAEIALSSPAMATACQINIHRQQALMPHLIQQLRERLYRNQLKYGKEMQQSHHSAQNVLQRVTQTTLGQLAYNCHVALSGSIVFLKSDQRHYHGQYLAKTQQIRVVEEDAYPQVLWDRTFPWLMIFDGFIPGTNTDQRLLEGLIYSLCFFVTHQGVFNESEEELLPYWNISQKQKWVVAQQQDRDHLQQIGKMVIKILQKQKLKKRERKFWNQLTDQVSSMYEKNHISRLESPEKVHVRDLAFFNISLAQIRKKFEGYDFKYLTTEVMVGREVIALSEGYQKTYQLTHVQVNSACEKKSVLWSTVTHPKHFSPEERTISAFLAVYRRMLLSRDEESLEYLGNYAHALMALGGQEKLAALFVPHLHRYLQEIVLPLGRQMCRGQMISPPPEPLESTVYPEPETTTYWLSFNVSGWLIMGALGLLIVGLLLRYGWSRMGVYKKESKIILSSAEQKKPKKLSHLTKTPKIKTRSEHPSTVPEIETSPCCSAEPKLKIQLREVKTTPVARRAAIVSLIEQYYPQSIQNANAIFIKTTVRLSDLEPLLSTLVGVSAINRSKHKESLLIDFTDGAQVSIAYCPPKINKPVSLSRKITQTMSPVDSQSENHRNPQLTLIHPTHKSMQVCFSGDVKKLYPSPLEIAKKLPSTAVITIIRHIESEFKRATGWHYDFSDPQGLESIYLTKGIELSHIIKSTSSKVRVKVCGGLIRRLLLGLELTTADLDMELKVPKGFKTEAFLESIKQMKMIQGYKKSMKTVKEMYIIEYRNSLVDVLISSHFAEEEERRGYNCELLSLEILFDSLESKLIAPESGQRFLAALKRGETPFIEMDIDLNDRHRLTDETVKSCIVPITLSHFSEREETEIEVAIHDLLYVPQQALTGQRADLSRFILNLLGYIQDPELLLRLFITWRGTGCNISPHLTTVVESLIPQLLHMAMVSESKNQQQKSALTRENLFFYFRKYLLKTLNRFDSLLPHDLILFRNIMLAGTRGEESLQKIEIDRLLSNAMARLETINRYLLDNLTALQENKSTTLTMDAILIALTITQGDLMVGSWVSSPWAQFVKRLESNAQLFHYTPNIDQLFKGTLTTEVKENLETKYFDGGNRQNITHCFRYYLLPSPSKEEQLKHRSCTLSLNTINSNSFG